MPESPVPEHQPTEVTATDTRFALPGVDDPAVTEVGIILLGLDARQLLTGLGLARLADDPALVTLAVDRLRHAALCELTSDNLVQSGIEYWRRLRPALAAAVPAAATGSLRTGWERAARTVTATVAGLGPASVAYLTTCWLRRDDIDRLAIG